MSPKKTIILPKTLNIHSWNIFNDINNMHLGNRFSLHADIFIDAGQIQTNKAHPPGVYLFINIS